MEVTKALCLPFQSFLMLMTVHAAAETTSILDNDCELYLNYIVFLIYFLTIVRIEIKKIRNNLYILQFINIDVLTVKNMRYSNLLKLV